MTVPTQSNRRTRCTELCADFLHKVSSDAGSPDERSMSGILEWQKLRCYKGGMTTNNDSDHLTHLSDHDLLSEVKALAHREREATARLIASLAELDARRLYLGEGCASLFTYCTQVLHLSEHAAYGRIEAARAARRCPVILDLLAEGSVTLTAVTLLAPHLTADNHQALLAAARHSSKREVESLVAAIRPQPAVPASVRKLPTPTPMPMPRVGAAAGALLPVATDPAVGPPSVPAPPVPSRAPSAAVVSQLAPGRYKVQFTVSRETYDELRHAQDLVRHTLPTGDPGVIFARALTLLVAELDRTKLAATAPPRVAKPTAPGSRHMPAAVKREVWARDGGQCAFVGTRGRCTERGFLEFHHLVPYAEGGASTTENVQIRCRGHNAYEADQWFGPPEPRVLRELPPIFRVLPTRTATSVSPCLLARFLPIQLRREKKSDSPVRVVEKWPESDVSRPRFRFFSRARSGPRR